MKLQTGLLLLTLSLSILAQDGAPPMKVEAEIRARIAAYEQAVDRVISDSKALPAGPERQQYLRTHLPEKSAVASAVLAICATHGHPSESIEAPLWILQVRAGGTSEDEARQILLNHHVRHPRLPAWISQLEWSSEPWCDAWLRSIEDRTGSRELLGTSLYVRARRDMRAADALWADLARIPAKSAVDPLRSSAEALLSRVSAEFGDLGIDSSYTLGQRAATDLYDLRTIALGCQAPDIEGPNDRGEIMRLRDLRGKVVVLSFWGFW